MAVYEKSYNMWESVRSLRKEFGYDSVTEIFSRVLRDSTPRFVRRSIGWSVGHTLLFYVFYSSTILLLPKCSGELKYGPCPPAHDWGSRVSSLVNCLTVDIITDSEIKYGQGSG